MNDFQKSQIQDISARRQPISRKLTLLVLCLLCFGSAVANAASLTVPLLDSLGAEQGTVKYNLVKGSVSAKFNLAQLPAVIATGTEPFTATIYKAYLISSTDPAVEIPLATIYPSTLGKAVVKTLLKGNVSLLGLDRFVVVAYSKDGLSSFDVLTGTLTLP